MARSGWSMAGIVVVGLVVWSGVVAGGSIAQAEPPVPVRPMQQMHHCGGMHHQVEVNSATVAELKTLPGVSEEDAARIVENRPYTRSEELVEKHAISPETYDVIAFLIVTLETAGN